MKVIRIECFGLDRVLALYGYEHGHGWGIVALYGVHVGFSNGRKIPTIPQLTISWDQYADARSTSRIEQSKSLYTIHVIPIHSRRRLYIISMPDPTSDPIHKLRLPRIRKNTSILLLLRRNLSTLSIQCPLLLFHPSSFFLCASLSLRTHI